MGCSSTKYYKASDVSAELVNNSLELLALIESVEHDFNQKENFYQLINKNKKDHENFLMQDLGYQMRDLKNKKRTFEHRSQNIKDVNDHFLVEVSSKEFISEDDPLFKRIDTFANSMKPQAESMFKAYKEYRETSENFERSIVISKNIWEEKIIQQ